MKKADREHVLRVNPQARYRPCLGSWCGQKDFFSTGPGHRFCPKCEAKKNDIEKNQSGIRIIRSDGDE